MEPPSDASGRPAGRSTVSEPILRSIFFQSCKAIQHYLKRDLHWLALERFGRVRDPIMEDSCEQRTSR